MSKRNRPGLRDRLGLSCPQYFEERVVIAYMLRQNVGCHPNPRRSKTMSIRRKRELWTGVSFLAVAIALGAVATRLDRRAAAQGRDAVQAPRFEVDPLWPKPLPNNWVLGNAI